MKLLGAAILYFSLAFALAGRDSGSWSGTMFAEVSFRIVDDLKGTSVSHAKIWLLTGSDYVVYQAALAEGPQFTQAYGAIERYGSRVFSGPDGEAKVWTEFEAAGANDGTSKFRYVDGIIIVEESSHLTFKSEISKLLGKKPDPKDLSPIIITVRLKQKANQTPEPTPPSRRGSS